MSLRLNVNSVIKSSTKCETSRDGSLSKQKIRKKGLKEGLERRILIRIQKSCYRSTLDIRCFCYAFSFFMFEMNRNRVLVGIPDTCVNRMLRIRTTAD